MAKNTKIIDVKQKLHHPVQPKKKSHIGEYFGEFMIVLLFFASIGITLYKYTGKGKFIEREVTDLISITPQGNIGFNDPSPSNPLDINSQDNNIFDISTFSTKDPTTLSFNSQALTQEGDSLGKITVNNENVINFSQEQGFFNDLSSRIEFVGNSNIDQYGRLKSSSIMPSISAGSVFCGGIDITGSVDPSLIILELVKYQGNYIGYLTGGSILENNGGLEDLITGAALSNTVFPVMLPLIANTGQIYLNSTSFFKFPFSTNENGAIILPSPSSAKDGDFINLICNNGTNVDSRLDYLSLAIRSIDEKPFAKNCILFNKNLQLGLAVNVGNSGLWKLSSATGQSSYSDQTFNDPSGIYQCSGNIPDVIVTSGSSNIIFLMVMRSNETDYQNSNSSGDGTTIKFVKIGGTSNPQWAIEGTTYANSGFFLQKTVK